MKNMTLYLFLNLLFLFSCKIASLPEAEQATKDRFLSTVANQSKIKTATLLVHSDALKIHWKHGHGSVRVSGQDTSAHPDQPFHVASIGKVFTSVLVLQQVEKGTLTLDTPIVNLIEGSTLSGLFIINGVDHAREVTIRHLLSHTSGIADYFESTDPQNKNAVAVIGEITKNPNQFWKPMDLVEFTRKNQKAVGLPGEKFSYSDTGYVLLGLILEKITKKKFESLLSENIFNPLGMNASYMHLRSLPKTKAPLPLSTMMLGETDVTSYQSISSDWAGGGIVSTTEDLLTFQRALLSGKLISHKFFEQMKGKQKFMDGIYYGLGLMTVRYGDMLFLFRGTPDLHGHSGLLSTLMFYCPEYDAHIISNFGSTDKIDDSFEMMFRIMLILKDVKEFKK
jgi:D-alanyl-D-alanine carboxypeptidase